MERDQKKHSERQITPELRTCIRLQTVGMSFVLAWPVAIILADMYGLESIIPIMSVLMVFTGVIIFAVGYIKRQELRERK